MAVTIRQLNGDASFLLTFEPIELDFADSAHVVEPFRILLDPWLVGPSNILHSRFSSSTHKHNACISTLRDLLEPDLVIVSNSRSDHCNEATLKELAPYGTKTLILAVPAAAKLIRSWRFFDAEKIITLERWQDPRQTGRDTTFRAPVPARVLGGDEGQVTVSFIAQNKHLNGLHSAIGITYRPAPSTRSLSRRRMTTLTRLSTPSSGCTSRMSSLVSHRSLELLDSPISPPLPAVTPLSPSTSPISHVVRTARSASSLSPYARGRSVSVVFAPHGISYNVIENYATSHLVSEAALPLTALLHCFDAVSKPWWLGGSVTSGLQDGQIIAAKLGSRAWISTYDGEKNISGIAKRLTRRTKYNVDEVRGYVFSETAYSLTARNGYTGKPNSRISTNIARPTEIMALGVGEEVALTSEGVWTANTSTPTLPDDFSHHWSIRHILHGNCSGESMA